MMDHFNRTHNGRAYQGNFTQSSTNNLNSEGSDPAQAEEDQVDGPNSIDKDANSSSTSDDETSSTSDSDASTEGLPTRNIDPLIDRAVLEYMINIRKRHQDARADYTDKLHKVAKIKHNEYFIDKCEYGQELYDDPLEIPRPESVLVDEYLKEYSDGEISDVPLSRVVGISTSRHQPYQADPNRELYYIKPGAINPSAQRNYNYNRASNGETYHLNRNVHVHESNSMGSRPGIILGGTSSSPRKKAWDEVVRSIPIMQRHVTTSTRSRIAMAQRVARLCNRELYNFWKRNEKEEREAKKRAEREAMEKLKQEEEARESKRQQNKLNFLITQTELYGHFIRKRLDNQPEEGAEVKEEAAAKDFNDIDFDQSDDELKKQAKLAAHKALKLNDSRKNEFDSEAAERKKLADGENPLSPSAALEEMNFQDPSSMQAGSNVVQPKMMTCTLKNYQIKGLNWLANLYEQGINGILADEMGLGKTVQSISMLAHLAENYDIWGPFMVIAPATTLHNWQQELTKFTPSLKVLPYWGSTRERKVLRQDWGKKQLYTRDAPFNVLITSYQLVISDASYIQRIKWQYMILDEAQAIKSSQSIRWKTLLKFHCRNRLLLTGTPIQNSMQELWSLLHFIMPSLFDSHDEFSDWFSRDIESHVENKGVLDQHQIQRLHLILKPFMLRRIKKNVQHELADKIELEVKCQLTPRQRQLYRGLREKISLSELLEKSRSALDGGNIESLMNLVIQFRKVCNHPELFERAEVQSPLSFCTFPAPPPVGDFNYLPYNVTSRIKLSIPRLFYHEQLLPPFNDSSNLAQLCKLQGSRFNLFSRQYIYSSSNQDGGCFGFSKLLGLSPTEISKVYGLNLDTLNTLNSIQERDAHLAAYKQWSQSFEDCESKSNLLSTMTPRSLIQSLNEHNDISSVATNFELFARMMKVFNCYKPKAISTPANLYCSHTSHFEAQRSSLLSTVPRCALLGREVPEHVDGAGLTSNTTLLDSSFPDNGLVGYSDTWIPATAKLILSSGKLLVLDKLLTQLKAEGHRVLIYFQMTKMIDIMEEFLTYRQYSYLRLDGSSRIEDRRDMVSDWQTRPDLFIFLLSTRAGGLGINLTAADTVIFYDSDWNPTVDQQAMDRAHRLGQTKQVTVYRLVTQHTIEERILQRAQQKDAIHRVVIANGDYKPPELKPKEIYSLLLDDDLDRPTTTAINSTQLQVAPINDEKLRLIEEVNSIDHEPTTIGAPSPTQSTGTKREHAQVDSSTEQEKPTNLNITQAPTRSNVYSVASLLTDNLDDIGAGASQGDRTHNRVAELRRPPTSIADLLSPQDSTPEPTDDPIENGKRFKSSPQDQSNSFPS